MSSRLIRDHPAAISPIAWRHAGHSPTPRSAEPHPESRPIDLDREIEARVQAAYQQGHAAGEAAAAQNAAQRLEPVLASLNSVIQDLAGTRKRFRAEAEADTVKLAIAIARRILHRELATNPDAILGLVIAAFQKLNARETHRLRTSLADAPALEQNRARLQLPPALEICPDASL